MQAGIFIMYEQFKKPQIMFGFFSKKAKKTIREDDVIWQAEDIKIHNLILRLADYSHDSDGIMIIAHFPKTLEQLIVSAIKNNLVLKELHTITDADRWATGYYSDPVVILSKAIHVSPNQPPAVQEEKKKKIIVAEHFPTPEKDILLMNWAINVKAESVQWYESTDSPIFTRFGGDQIRILAEKLGWKQNESMQHRFITSSIGSMQEKILRKSTGDGDAEDIMQWFKSYVPSSL